MTTLITGERLLSVREAAHYIGRSENALRKLIGKDKEYIKVIKARDGSIRISQAELDAFMRGDAQAS